LKRNIFAVCDLEVDYALNFMDYMNRKKNIPFEIQAFTSVENLIAYGNQTRIVAVDLRAGYVPGSPGSGYREDHHFVGRGTPSGT
jgi:hypothetical protein